MTENPQLPAIRNEFLTELQITIPAPILVGPEASIEDTRRADILLFNSSLTVLYALWAEVKTFSAALAMIDKTMALIEKRRAILGHPYGSPQIKTSQGATFEPLP